MGKNVKPIQGWKTKDITKLPSKGANPTKVNLRREDFDKLILDQGVRVKVYRTIMCPRVKSIDGAEHDIDCPLCRGHGFLDKYPLDTWSFIQNQNLEKNQLAEGLYDGNTVSATFLQGVELQYFTLVELCDFTDLYIERLKKQDGNTDLLMYRGVRVNLVIDENGKEYFEGSDFALNQDGNIQWCPNKGPEAGDIYSINYETSVKFRAIKAMHVNRFAQVSAAGGVEMTKMNEQWLLQKSFLVQRNDASGNPIKPNKIRDSDSIYDDED